MGEPMESTSPRDTLNGPSGPLCKLAHQTKNHLAVTVGDIMRRYGDSYRQSHILCPEQSKALHAISTCRTAALGGHLYRCDHCGAEIRKRSTNPP